MSWQQSSGCITAHTFVKKLNATNYTSERTLGVLSAFNMREVSRSRM